jgi:hypothetical protein
VTARLDRLLGLHGVAFYLIVGLLVFAEDALFVGFVVPGETAAMLGGVAASRGHVSLTLICALVVAAAIVGDTVGYEIGARYGVRLLSLRVLRRRRRQIDAARAILMRLLRSPMPRHSQPRTDSVDSGPATSATPLARNPAIFPKVACCQQRGIRVRERVALWSS